MAEAGLLPSDREGESWVLFLLNFIFTDGSYVQWKTFLGQNSYLVLKKDLYTFKTGEKIHTITDFLK